MASVIEKENASASVVVSEQRTERCDAAVSLVLIERSNRGGAKAPIRGGRGGGSKTHPDSPPPIPEPAIATATATATPTDASATISDSLETEKAPFILRSSSTEEVLLEQEIDPNYVPSEEEILEYAKWLEIDLNKEQDLFWIATKGLKEPLPKNWRPCKTKDTEDVYYFNIQTGESTWEHPVDSIAKRLLEAGRKTKENYSIVRYLYEMRKTRERFTFLNANFIKEEFSKFLLASPAPAPTAKIDYTIYDLRDQVFGDDPNAWEEASRKIRRLLSLEDDPPIDDAINVGIVPRLLEFMQMTPTSPFSTLQFEATWALTNIASGTHEHTCTVVDAGAVPVVIQLLASPSADVAEQAAWCLGNIAGDCVAYRDLVLQHNAVPAFLALANTYNDTTKLSLVRTSTWAVQNLCRCKPSPDKDVVSPILPMLTKYGIFSKDMETVNDAWWALGYLMEIHSDNVQAALDAGAGTRLVELLKFPGKAQSAALRAVGNIASSTHAHTDVIVNLGVVEAITKLLTHPKSNIVKEAFWVLSNIAAGTTSQISRIISAGVIGQAAHFIDSTSDKSNESIKKEANFLIANAAKGADAQQIKQMIQQGAVVPLCQILISMTKDRVDVDSSVLATNVAIEGLTTLLEKGSSDITTVTIVTTTIKNLGCINIFNSLTKHNNEKLQKWAKHFINSYMTVMRSVQESMNKQR